MSRREDAGYLTHQLESCRENRRGVLRGETNEISPSKLSPAIQPQAMAGSAKNRQIAGAKKNLKCSRLVGARGGKSVTF